MTDFEITGEGPDVDISAPWGTLRVIGGEIYGLQQLWLPNMSMSPLMARDLAEHLTLAAEKAEPIVEAEPS